MNIYFILLFVAVGFYYIVKSVNLPTSKNKSNLFNDLKIEGEALTSYTRYVATYYLIIGILLILLPFIYMVTGSAIAYVVGAIFIIGAIMIHNKKISLSRGIKK